MYLEIENFTKKLEKRLGKMQEGLKIGDAVLCWTAQSCPTPSDPVDCSLSGSCVHGDSPGKNTGMGCHALLQGIFQTQESNRGLLHCRQILYQMSYQGSPPNRGSVQFSHVRLFDPMNCSMPGLPVHHQLLELTQIHVYRIDDAIQPSHPLSSPSPPTLYLSQHQGLFKWVSSSHQGANVLEFQLQRQSFQWTFRTDLL